jgi:membrane protein DedA with SNARE-associated domain
VLTAIGSGIWNAVFIALGWTLGEDWDRVQAWLGPVGWVVTGLLVIGVVVLVLRRRRSRSAAARST